MTSGFNCSSVKNPLIASCFLDFAALQDEQWKRDSESRVHRDLKGSSEEVRHHRGDRERAERDTHRERRHREGEDLQRNHHRDRTSSNKSASDKSHRHETKTEVCMHTRCLYTVICRSFYFILFIVPNLSVCLFFPMYHFCDPGCSKGI